jgi:hypothetical protein
LFQRRAAAILRPSETRRRRRPDTGQEETMNTRKRSWVETVIARITYGSVPFDAMYWLDPEEEFRTRAQSTVATRDVRALEARQALPTEVRACS